MLLQPKSQCIATSCIYIKLSGLSNIKHFLLPIGSPSIYLTQNELHLLPSLSLLIIYNSIPSLVDQGQDESSTRNERTNGGEPAQRD